MVIFSFFFFKSAKTLKPQCLHKEPGRETKKKIEIEYEKENMALIDRHQSPICHHN